MKIEDVITIISMTHLVGKPANLSHLNACHLLRTTSDQCFELRSSSHPQFSSWPLS